VAEQPKQQLEDAGDVGRLEAELAAARRNVERLSRQLEAARNRARAKNPRHTRASLGYMNFTYDQGGAAGGTVLAFDGGNGTLMWKLDVPLDSDSVIRCYDNDTLLIKSADGYTRLVTAADGTVIRAWAPGVEAPPAKREHGVNPFGISAPPASTARPSPAQPSGLPPRDWQDAEKRMDRLEESVRALTEAVDRLAREQKEQRTSPGPAAPGVDDGAIQRRPSAPAQLLRARAARQSDFPVRSMLRRTAWRMPPLR
jgi:hypothetical protein